MTSTILMALAAAVGIASAGHAQVPAGDPVLGTWTNPQRSLRVRTAPCGAHLCGTIVQATNEALTDARDAGVTGLIGTQLLSDYTKVGPKYWAGRVYVPDMGRTFSSRITELSPSTLKISGCLIGGWICRSQIWSRVE
jgi:uncharacterized protein (DUF2147 family)